MAKIMGQSDVQDTIGEEPAGYKRNKWYYPDSAHPHHLLIPPKKGKHHNVQITPHSQTPSFKLWKFQINSP